MPTIKNIKGKYRLFLYSFDCNEPKQVHVQKDKEGLRVIEWVHLYLLEHASKDFQTEILLIS